MQTSCANSEHKHSEIKRFLNLDIKRTNQSKDSVIVNKSADLH